MVQRLWGCYSVRDHTEPRAFVADLLLYDRLVVPVPASDDFDRWAEKGWDPARQHALLAAAGPFVERVEWSSALRDQFRDEYPQALAAAELDSASQLAAGEVPWALTRQILSDQLHGDLLRQGPAGDIRAISVYAQPDRFDREWRIKATFPFFHRDAHVSPGPLREAGQPVPAAVQHLAHVVVTRLVVPDDGPSDLEVLHRTVELISRSDVSARRAAFQQLLAHVAQQGLRDETVVGEVEDLLDAYNSVIAKHSKATRSRAAVQIVTAAEGAAALWVPPVGIATGPTAAAGEALIQRTWGDTTIPAALDAVGLLAQARDALCR